MSDNQWPGIRPGAAPLRVYNEGRMVYLFDVENVQTFQDSGADFRSGFAEKESETDPRLRKLAREGRFIAYSLDQDDEVRLEIVVGPPLTKKELAVARWHKPQRALLRIGSGRLQVHSANTLPLGLSAEDGPPHDPPAEAVVPPGDYAATLYRLDWNALRNDGLISDEDAEDERLWRGPQEVLTLTPAADAKPVRGVKSHLPFPDGDFAAGLGKHRIAEGVFTGKALFTYWWSNFFVNMDKEAAEALGLAPGMTFRVEVGKFAVDAVFLGDSSAMEAEEYEEWARRIAGDRPEFGLAYRPIGRPLMERTISVTRVVSTTPFCIHERWLPARVTLLADRFQSARQSAADGDDAGPERDSRGV